MTAEQAKAIMDLATGALSLVAAIAAWIAAAKSSSAKAATERVEKTVQNVSNSLSVVTAHTTAIQMMHAPKLENNFTFNSITGGPEALEKRSPLVVTEPPAQTERKPENS
jgi:hypothetical protein